MAKLRIKADKELTELERFGFYINNSKTAYWYDLKKEIHFYEDMEWEANFWLAVYVKDRELRFVNDFKCNKEVSLIFDVKTLSVICDLIKSDLVEKVEEGE